MITMITQTSQTKHDRIILKMSEINEKQRRLEKECEKSQTLQPNYPPFSIDKPTRHTCVRLDRFTCQVRINSHNAGAYTM